MSDHLHRPADDNDIKTHERRRLVRRLAAVAPLVLGVLVVLLLACVLWIPRWLYPSLTDSDLKNVRTAENQPDAAKIQELKSARLKLQNDARTTLLQGLAAILVLTGAGIGAAVTLRQIKVGRDQLQTTREQMEHTLESTQQQLRLTEQGLVTDRYTKAVEQLGHEKAPVRLGALYSLEHLAQDNPEYRQTVVDVFCAYLRMPYTPPSRSDPDATQVEQAVPQAEDGIPAAHPRPAQSPAQEELQVRQTAHHLLADHLRCPPGTSGKDAQLLPASPRQAFWPSISLDLTGATLADFNFALVSIMQAQFVGATFYGDAVFDKATFHGNARFVEATFHGKSWFGGAAFHGNAEFDKATFQRDATFGKATFDGNTWFGGAIFHGSAEFVEATFHGKSWFAEATFQGTARFHKATFLGDARFQDATFQRKAWFSEVIFQGDTWFLTATFQGAASFSKATFQDNTWFGAATFQGAAALGEATFHGRAVFDRATFHDNAAFAKATFHDIALFAEATFQRDARFGQATFQRDARFDEAIFTSVNGAEGFAGAHVLHLDDSDLQESRVWPDGYTVRPDPGDRTRGTLVPAELAEEPEPAVPPPSTGSRDA